MPHSPNPSVFPSSPVRALPAPPSIVMTTTPTSSQGSTADAELSVPAAGYPCVTRLRHRRLVALLLNQGFVRAYGEVMYLTGAHMCLDSLQFQVYQGKWMEAVQYLDRHLPPRTGPGSSKSRSLRSDVLRDCLLTHHRFALAFAGKSDADHNKSQPVGSFDLCHRRDVSHADLRLRSISMSVLAYDREVPPYQANFDWERVRNRAAVLISRFAPSVPELRCCITLPTYCCTTPQHVLPIASGSWRQRYQVKKKDAGFWQRRTKSIIRALKRQRRAGSRTIEEAKELLADLVDETLGAGVLSNKSISVQRREAQDGRKRSRDESTTATEDHEPKQQRPTKIVTLRHGDWSFSKDASLLVPGPITTAYSMSLAGRERRPTGP